ncbi:hypothetical protein DTL42_18040 [Bremerella cremea]|uniref:Uncharacterized protein n=1 Tax=Bremerella cremea TaxID=1031537 RepID=A0A368KMX4_9BACT|nr:hypothetical protein [Bremerella cremea]RCS44032.1 hypothetical protein DTL42_18040 [Bremerella cremea]
MSFKNYRYLFGISAALILTWLVWLNFFSGNQAKPPIVLSRETTYFAPPGQAADTLNFCQLWHAQLEATTKGKANNALPLLKATWPRDQVEDTYTEVHEALGGFPIPANKEELLDEKVIAEVEAWLGQMQGNARANCLPSLTILEARRAPWKRETIPPLTDWVQRHNETLDLLHQVTLPGGFYCPDPAQLAGNSWVGDHSRFCSQQITRAAAALEIRAMFRIGTTDLEGAWEDIQSVFALSHLGNCQRSDDIQERLALRRQAYHCTLALVTSGNCEESLLREIDHYLSALPSSRMLLSDAILYQRIVAIDAFRRVYSGESRVYLGRYESLRKQGVPRIDLDGNAVLRNMNAWFDKALTLLAPSNFGDEQHAMTLAQSIARLKGGARERELVSASASERERLIAANLVTLTELKQLCILAIGCDGSDVQAELLRVSIALELFKDTHGRYPNTLADLGVLADGRRMMDPYTQDVFVYKLRDDGYLLYSVGLNRKDDLGTGGDAICGEIRRGEWAIGSGPSSSEEFDIVIRVPIPILEICRPGTSAPDEA